MKPISVVIVEDEPEQRELLKVFLEEIGNIQLLGVADDANSAFREITTKKPDLVFFDLELHGYLAFDVLKDLKEVGTESEIIFTTSHHEYAIRVFEYSDQKFLLKPFGKSQLIEAIENYKSKDKKESKLFDNLDYFDAVKFKDGQNIVYIHPLDIFYCKADSRYASIFTSKDKSIFVSSNLGEIKDKFSNLRIARIHKSYLINTAYVKRFDYRRNEVYLRKDVEEVVLPVSRKYRGLF